MSGIRKSDAKLINRAAIVSITALALGLGVAVAQQSGEFAKFLPATEAREALFFVAPLATLATVQYTLAGKSFSFKTLAVEGLMLGGAYAWFLAVVLRGYVGTASARDDCGWLSGRISGCGDTWSPNNYLTVGLILGGIIFSFLAIWMQMRRDKL